MSCPGTVVTCPGGEPQGLCATLLGRAEQRVLWHVWPAVRFGDKDISNLYQGMQINAFLTASGVG